MPGQEDAWEPMFGPNDSGGSTMQPDTTHRWVVGMGWVCREHGSGCWRCGWSPATKATPTSRG